MQKLTHKQLQREATQRLNEFMGQIRNQTSVDLSAKNLGEEGCAYVVEALAFNDRCRAVLLLHSSGPSPPAEVSDRNIYAIMQ